MKGRNKVKVKKAKAAALVVAIALAIALTGTFAWQSVNQTALNEANEPDNPGGRLHDDFSGFEATDTKDIYVENFGNQVIYARVRLDEYMEIGKGAGLFGTVDGDGNVTRNPENEAVPLVEGTDINNVATWTTHLPGESADETGVGTEEPEWKDPTKTFHTFWTWTMGGQDTTGNPDGKTVYMPTFNKNKDSLKADINGTMAGLDKNPDEGELYDDYHKYTANETAARVRDTDAETYPDGAAYDKDEDTTDECGPYGGAGGTGVENTNYEMKEETHTARETMSASVITMGEYKLKSPADKAAFQGWVYDADGWAYWSQPIKPGTPTETDKFVTNATGLLLDRIVMTNQLSDPWYYGINAVGQFITADDLGRIGTTKSGFYTEGQGPAPSEDALNLLEGIGVNTAAVDGAVAASASVTVGDVVRPLDYAVPGMNIDLSSAVTVAGEESPDQAVTWTVTGNTDPATAITAPVTRSAGAVLHVGNDEEGTLTLVATSGTYDRLRGILTLPVRPVTYFVTVTPDGDGVLPGATQGFTAKLESNDFQSGLPQEFDWSLDGTYADGTSVAANETDSSKATLTAGALETGAVTVKATPKDTTTYPGVSGTAAVSVTPVHFDVDIKNTAETPASVTNTTVVVAAGNTATFTVSATSTPAGATSTDNWTWSSNNVDGGITVENNGTVTVAKTADTGVTATITATNSDYTPALTASFTVSSLNPAYTLSIKDKDGNTVSENVIIKRGGTADFSLDILSEPTGHTPGGTWTWTSATTSVATVTPNETDSTKATVTIPEGAPAAQTSVITVTNSAEPTLNTTFTIEVEALSIEEATVGDVTSVDGIKFIVLEKGVNVTGTDGNTHSAALLISKDILGKMAHNSSNDPKWSKSNIRTYLNSEDATYDSSLTFDSGSKGWLAAHPTIKEKAIQVPLQTRESYNSGTMEQTDDKVFLLSSADVSGQYDDNGTWKSAQNAEYSTGSRINYFGTTGAGSSEPLRNAKYNGSDTGWWLRSPSNNSTNVARVNVGGSLGNYGANGASGGVRPAFWYNLDP